MFLNPSEILGRLSISSGSRVGDFGTGQGTFALAIARKLGSETTIYAFDALGHLVEGVGREGRKTGARFYAVVADLNQGIPLKDHLLDIAIAANLIHALRERALFTSELARVVRPGGRVLVVDWADSFKNMGPTAESAVTPGAAVQLFERAGFEAGGMLPAGTHHYAFIATRMAQPA